MTIDKRALREVAEKATPGTWRRTSSLFNGITVTPFSLCGEEVTLAHTVEKRDAEFIAAANPATMLALLDENIQLQREKDATEAVALALRDDMRQAREQLEATEKRIAEQREYYEGVIADGSKRIAELENGHQEAAKQINSWRRLAKQNIAERGKDISELEAARQRIAELEARAVNLPKRSVGEVMHLSGFSRDYAEGWCAGNDNAMHEIRAAGIKVKGE
ncbi:ead/Ea22-like family protein [Salmonella enterica]|uniref:Ead/Ea22-like family protein n=7 Tax=Salmonella enterica TaxID=28901 RepID=A0A8F6RL18_SALET|nr:ead/Ea22-like family protein [Salmonella enterica]ECT0951268.1 ead/Ea22-like family protein [Salmonella enterica subsp. enterica serovar Saintpaul]EDA9876624.1 ead/Ea22-like family protein [Salmonella enterica subsp. enterica serovar Rubislaw]EDK2610633.1 ead/Ea22-like family protein [Salmonella enterica subsp. enterica serovar Muenchen]EDX3293582.1 ead/Ea22-like family protein [Salmonella enterica subsp. enterica serovar Luciana]EAA7760671.1 ead/Ea22-like family protein [Salmonella enteric